MEKCQDYKNCVKGHSGYYSCRGCELRNLSEIDERFTQYYNSKERVEVEWKEGFEDYGGYGSRTDGKKARFYVGMSSGRLPIYLQIYRKDSTGGQCILSIAVKSICGLGVYNRY